MIVGVDIAERVGSRDGDRGIHPDGSRGRSANHERARGGGSDRDVGRLSQVGGIESVGHVDESIAGGFELDAGRIEEMDAIVHALADRERVVDRQAAIEIRCQRIRTCECDHAVVRRVWLAVHERTHGDGERISSRSHAIARDGHSEA